jgi:tetratricopeptide (TPR) repeat protein
MMEQETQDHLETGTPRPFLGVLANLLALVLLIASATLIADFTHRLLAADVDKIGLLSVALQIATAVVASSAFTKRGTALIDGLFTTKKGRRTRTFIRLALAVGTFAFTLACWIYLPPRLAQHYYNEGLGAYLQSQTTGTDTIQAILFNERAIALDPTQQGFYVLQGTLMEGLYRYDAAEDQYRKAVAANPRDPIGYNNLARLLILDGKPAAALKAVETGLGRNQPIPVATAGLLKNKAWAEWLLGFSQAAIADAKQSQIEQKKAGNPNAAAATCLLGEIYGKLRDNEQARAEWQLYLLESKQPLKGQPAIEPDCQLNAEVDNAKN